ncbi:reverse transcriptase [Phytophthora megakarya]|uniref:Reverse transcriptase n=1 Tax=Phytophthora megakarya TaxID=4795 RepID=A0A225UYM6_9STRA|nr:reverse transcriptase [Phytophthora megakarya]
MKSFLGSLNYYSRFIEDYAIYASVLYELREIDFAAMAKETTQGRIQQMLEAEGVDPRSQEDRDVNHRRTLDPEAPDPMEVDPRWIHAHRAFNVLKSRIATTPILRHFDPDRKATVVVYASDGAISGALMQEYDQIYYPVKFASRTLKSNELKYGIAEKEVLALPRTLDLNYNALELYIVSFDGSAHVKSGGGAYSAILWRLPEWRVVKARSGYAEGLTVNEAEYHGLLLCLDLLEDLDPQRLVICGDSNLVIRQVRGEIDYHELLHVKRDWNGSAALQRQCGIEIESDAEIQDLITLNTLDEILMVKVEEETIRVSAVTTRSKARSGVRAGSDPDSLREEVVRELRIERIRQAQDEESWIMGLKKYLIGEIRDLTQEEARMFGSIAMNYDVDQLALFYCPTSKKAAAD